jgi:hypothetical protein
MPRDEMIKMAIEAGWQYADGDDGYDPLWRFAALVAAAEREACAKLCVVQAQSFSKSLEEAVAAERDAACRIVTGLCISDNNAREICEAIRERSKA